MFDYKSSKSKGKGIKDSEGKYDDLMAADWVRTTGQSSSKTSSESSVSRTQSSYTPFGQPSTSETYPSYSLFGQSSINRTCSSYRPFGQQSTSGVFLPYSPSSQFSNSGAYSSYTSSAPPFTSDFSGMPPTRSGFGRTSSSQSPVFRQSYGQTFGSEMFENIPYEDLSQRDPTFRRVSSQTSSSFPSQQTRTQTPTQRNGISESRSVWRSSPPPTCTPFSDAAQYFESGFRASSSPRPTFSENINPPLLGSFRRQQRAPIPPIPREPRNLVDIYRDRETGRPNWEKMRRDSPEDSEENQSLADRLAQRNRQQTQIQNSFQKARKTRMKQHLRSRGYEEFTPNRFMGPSPHMRYSRGNRPQLIPQFSPRTGYHYNVDVSHTQPVSSGHRRPMSDPDLSSISRYERPLQSFARPSRPSESSNLDYLDSQTAERYENERDWDYSPNLYERKVYNPTQMRILDSDAQRLKDIRKSIHAKSKSRSERRENVRQSARLTPVLQGIDTNLDSISEENFEEDSHDLDEDFIPLERLESDD